ncbi:MAG: hypothetical protein IFNCLDLE_00249 [Ignavibacteriaceae bacterium]|nr:hypothetical protein [Ignavibacteriaceae bacterium]
MIFGAVIYIVIITNIEMNRLTRTADDLKSSIKIEQSTVKQNRAVLDKLISKEYLMPIVAKKFDLRESDDSIAPLVISADEIKELEEKINTISE